MTSEVEERPRFVTGSYGRHRSQRVKDISQITENVKKGFPENINASSMEEFLV